MTEQNEANASKILGIDYGESKMGLAMADFETRMAFAYKTLTSDKNLEQNLAEIIEEENISKVIIGCPHLEPGVPSEFPGKRLGNFLADRLKVEVEYEDEMFTTKQAYQNLIEKGVKGIKRYDDEEAARIILQSWLDRKPHNT